MKIGVDKQISMDIYLLAGADGEAAGDQDGHLRGRDPVRGTQPDHHEPPDAARLDVLLVRARSAIGYLHRENRPQERAQAHTRSR